MSQSGLLLSLARADLDLQDEILEFLIRELAYADDLHTGVTAQEVLNLQKELFPSTPCDQLRERCHDKIFCPPVAAGATPATSPATRATPTTRASPAARASSLARTSPTMTTGQTCMSLAGWQGGRVSEQSGVQPQIASCAPPDTEYKRAAVVGRQPLAPPPPADKTLMC